MEDSGIKTRPVQDLPTPEACQMLPPIPDHESASALFTPQCSSSASSFPPDFLFQPREQGKSGHLLHKHLKEWKSRIMQVSCNDTVPASPPSMKIQFSQKEAKSFQIDCGGYQTSGKLHWVLHKVSCFSSREIVWERVSEYHETGLCNLKRKSNPKPCHNHKMDRYG